MDIRKLQSANREARAAYLDYKNVEGTIVGNAKRKLYEEKEAAFEKQLAFAKDGMATQTVTTSRGREIVTVALYDK